MTRSALLAVTVTLAAFFPHPAEAGDGRLVRTCSSQSQAYFPGAYRSRDNLVLGPLAWLGANMVHDDGAYGSAYRWKHPVLVRPGRTVSLRIGAAARGFAGLSYDFQGWSFARTARTVVFQGCLRAKARSRTDGRPVTFWSGGIVSTRGSACVPIEIRIDRGAVRRRTLALGDARC